MSDVNVPTFYLNGLSITKVSSECYLGVLISDNLSDDGDIKKEMCKLYARGNTLICRFKHCSDEVKKQLFLLLHRFLLCIFTVYFQA